MTAAPLRLVVLGLSLSSSWGNGHATTYRTLLKGLAARGHHILFLERDVPWYADNRDLADPAFCRLALYRSVGELAAWENEVRRADLVIVGSYVPDGIAVARSVRSWARSLAFYDIDTPVTLAKLEAGTCDYLAAEDIPRFDLYLSFTAGPLLKRIEQQYGAPAARALFCAADADLYCPDGPEEKRWDLGYLGTYSADRQPALERLLLDPARRRPQAKFIVAGPQFPTDIVWPDNVERIEHLPPPAHAGFYRSLRWTLNITRTDMIAAGHSPSVRLFEAAACATPILSDCWDGLDLVFHVGREIVTVRQTADVLRALDRPEAERAAIGAAARARFLAAHTAAHRARQLESYIEATAAQVISSTYSPPAKRSTQ